MGFINYWMPLLPFLTITALEKFEKLLMITQQKHTKPVSYTHLDVYKRQVEDTSYIATLLMPLSQSDVARACAAFSVLPYICLLYTSRDSAFLILSLSVKVIQQVSMSNSVSLRTKMCIRDRH